jgi:hypothetical protein
VNDDWRLRITLHEREDANTLADGLAASVLERELIESIHDRIIVSRDDAEVFCYTATREQAETAEVAIRAIAEEHAWEPDFELTHWHPTAEAWEDPDAPLPQSDADRAAEHAEMIAREHATEREHGYPDYEVRIECVSRKEALAFSEQLRAEGIANVNRFKYLLIGATDEDAAQALADRLRTEAPAGSVITVEGTLASVEAGEARSRFAIFTGIAGG